MQDVAKFLDKLQETVNKNNWDVTRPECELRNHLKPSAWLRNSPRALQARTWVTRGAVESYTFEVFMKGRFRLQARCSSVCILRRSSTTSCACTTCIKGLLVNL